jgi:hypothetical protein
MAPRPRCGTQLRPRSSPRLRDTTVLRPRFSLIRLTREPVHTEPAGFLRTSVKRPP